MTLSASETNYLSESLIDESADFIRKAFNKQDFEIALILGTGLGEFADKAKGAINLPYSGIPGFTESTVKGHGGQLVSAELNGKSVLMMQGRSHFYEGIPMQQIVFPIRVMHRLGIRKIVITNSAGACNEKFNAGEFMLIKDHINFTLTNPLIGKNIDSLGPRFPDNAQVYHEGFIRLAREVAAVNGIVFQEGSYMFFTGPTYETPAEVKMAVTLGADAVGMSTFPEALTASHCGISVLGISYLSNMAAGIHEGKLDHEEVLQMDPDLKRTFISFLVELIQKA